MSHELVLLINKLKEYKDPIKRPKALNFVNDYNMFIESLERIHDLVGLETAKQQVVRQVKSFIVNYRRTGKPTNKELLHSLIYGPPGTGKTELGKLLAELWSASGCLYTKSSNEGLFLNWNKSELSRKDPKDLKSLQQIKELTSTVKHYETTFQNLENLTKEALTRLNNLRKKVKPKPGNKNSRIQSKFQHLKELLRALVRNLESVREPKLPAKIEELKLPPFPVIIPQTPDRELIENLKLPKLELELIEPKPTQPKVPKFSRVTRGDLIGKYQGHTTDRVRTILSQHIGGVLMIDEAYSLLTSPNDDFGKEALTEIINFMTSWPDKIVFIFAGYRKEIEETILKYQPGLARRFNWTFEIEGYSPKELASIFQKQVYQVFSELNGETKIVLSDLNLDSLSRFFERTQSKFPYFGGDTQRLAYCLKEIVNSRNWELALDDTLSLSEFEQGFYKITPEIIEAAFQIYLNNSARLKEDESHQRSFEKVRHLYL